MDQSTRILDEIWADFFLATLLFLNPGCAEILFVASVLVHSSVSEAREISSSLTRRRD